MARSAAASVSVIAVFSGNRATALGAAGPQLGGGTRSGREGGGGGNTCNSALQDGAVLQLDLHCLVGQLHQKPAGASKREERHAIAAPVAAGTTATAELQSWRDESAAPDELHHPGTPRPEGLFNEPLGTAAANWLCPAAPTRLRQMWRLKGVN